MDRTVPLISISSCETNSAEKYQRALHSMRRAELHLRFVKCYPLKGEFLYSFMKAILFDLLFMTLFQVQTLHRVRLCGKMIMNGEKLRTWKDVLAA
jgi:hypothetical protein